jgi:hypothetical protein
MHNYVKSQIFSEKLRLLSPVSLRDVQKAMARVLVDPTLTQYERPYLGNHRQEHPSDKTVTIFFELLPNKTVYFAWINDDSCPHNSFKNYEDPCRKEFLRLKGIGEIPTYSQDFDEGEFEVTPRPNKPSFISFEKYGVSVFSAIYNDTKIFYTMAVTTHAQDHEIHDHYEIFFEKVREHFVGTKQAFEIRVNTGDNSFEDLVRSKISLNGWVEKNDSGNISWSIK